VRGRSIGAAVLVAVVVVAGCAEGDPTRGGSDGTSTSAAGASGGETALEWPTAGGDLANRRAVGDTAISSSTIGDLDTAWRAGLPDAAALTTAPIVVEGVVYLQGGSGQVVAVGLDDGAVLWTSEPTGVNIGPFGVAVDADHVYALDGAQGVVALDRTDGATVW
jgi:outer membrane protein assembly factor BamB